MTEKAQTAGHAGPSIGRIEGACVKVCAAAAMQNKAPVILAGEVGPRRIATASPTKAPTAPPRARSSKPFASGDIAWD